MSAYPLTYKREILVYEEDGVTLVDSFINGISATTGEQAIGRIEKVEVGPRNRCLEMRFHGRNDKIGIDYRYIVHYRIGASNRFWGVCVTNPHPDSKGVGFREGKDNDQSLFVIKGGEKLVEDSLIYSPYFIETPTDIATIAFEFCSRFANPALTVDVGNFSATGFLLDSVANPEQHLNVLLDSLASADPNGAVWYVDNTGTIKFHAE